MIVRPMQLAECQKMLAETRLFRLACALQNQPYVVPVYAVYHENSNGSACLYGCTTFGQKLEWMRVNPLVCVETDQLVGWSQWKSLVVTGRYVELEQEPENGETLAPRLPFTEERSGELTPAFEHSSERLLAHELLQDYAEWWEPAASIRAAASEMGRNQPFSLVFYKIEIENVSGYEATRDPPSDTGANATGPLEPSWIKRIWVHCCGKE